MDLIIKGIVTGLVLSFMVGPVFFVLLETSIKKGIRAAVAFDLGVLLNDVVYILIAYVFYNQVSDLSKGKDNSLLLIIGGSLFLIYGVYNFFKKVQKTEVKVNFHETSTAKDYVLLFIKGFLLNLANPMVVFYWFSVMTLGTKGKGVDTSLFFFLAIILITFFSIDFLKILGAKKLRPLVTHKVLVGLNRLIGTVFIVFGIILVIKALGISPT